MRGKSMVSEFLSNDHNAVTTRCDDYIELLFRTVPYRAGDAEYKVLRSATKTWGSLPPESELGLSGAGDPFHRLIPTR